MNVVMILNNNKKFTHDYLLLINVISDK